MLLEIGSGNLKSHSPVLGEKIIHVDIDPKAYHLETACDAHHLPFKDNTFEVVYCSHVLEHCLNPHQILKEIHRVTKTCAILKVPNKFAKEDSEHIYSWTEHTLNNLASKLFKRTKTKNTYLIRPTQGKIKNILRYYIGFAEMLLTRKNEITLTAFKT
jgi:ubiquinone/menaquinone biosynthesis C-methylase UbiE